MFHKCQYNPSSAPSKESLTVGRAGRLDGGTAGSGSRRRRRRGECSGPEEKRQRPTAPNAKPPPQSPAITRGPRPSSPHCRLFSLPSRHTRSSSSLYHSGACAIYNNNHGIVGKKIQCESLERHFVHRNIPKHVRHLRTKHIPHSAGKKAHSLNNEYEREKCFRISY
jgi:hypothetical protein